MPLFESSSLDYSSITVVFKETWKQNVGRIAVVNKMRKKSLLLLELNTMRTLPLYESSMCLDALTNASLEHLEADYSSSKGPPRSSLN